jgi:type III restriction enzyme
VSLLVDNPIVNSPFEEPTRYWDFREGQPVLAEGRRPAGYYLRPRLRGEQASLLEEEFVPLDLVNVIRDRVRAWRARDYPGITPLTRQLLQHWSNPDRERRLFFCQLEAAETLIWLIEAPPSEKQGIEIPHDDGLTRYASKMATGSGKTVVMGMVIAWQVLNKLAKPQDRRFSDAVLLVCPNLTIRERLQVLLPWKERNYYIQFNLIPPGLMEKLQQGKFEVTNWHVFQPEDDSRTRSVVKRGPEGDSAFCRRVLKDLGSKQNILVINDEAHHAYRPRPLAEEEREGLKSEEIEEREEATVWVGGLDRIARSRGINLCADFSATPFHIQGSGYEPGTPFPWVVSDFGLVDAIESGITKIPRVPVETNSGALIPEYFRLWEHINKKLPASERQTARRRAKPESVLREAEPALATLANEWRETLRDYQAAGSPIPPALIVVCDNTDLSKLVHEHVATGKVLSELKNQDGDVVTFRIDTKLLKEAESAVEGETKEQAAERLRKVVDTIGKIEWEGPGDPPGKDIRCVVSVGMLTEGWDAQNVTQILGLRAFTSQLLCEQVVGRGLRRINYDDFTEPEYVDVYGVPFEVIPVMKKRVGRTATTKVSTLIRALPERKQLEITFPRVEGFVFDVRRRIRVNWDDVPALLVTPAEEPTEVVAKAAVGYRIGRPDRLGPGKEVVQDREEYYREHRLQGTVFEIAAEITRQLKDRRQDWEDRRVLFPQVLEIAWRYVEERILFADKEVPPEEIGLLRYRQRIAERLTQAIEPDTDAGELPLLPVIERFRPIGSTSEVLFRTVRPTVGTTKSHISHVVLDSPRWEGSVAYRLEQMNEVIAYARNDHMDFAIPYEYMGVRHEYRPDYLVKLQVADGKIVMLILEVKGFESEQDRAKEATAKRWVRAVNHHGDFGHWKFRLCRDPMRIGSVIREAIGNQH